MKKASNNRNEDDEEAIKVNFFNFSTNYYFNYKQIHLLSSISQENINKAILIETVYYTYILINKIMI